jgi:hypothetical protein
LPTIEKSEELLERAAGDFVPYQVAEELGNSARSAMSSHPELASRHKLFFSKTMSALRPVHFRNQLV